MPVLDGCINALFEPGNIGASSGTPPVIIRKTSLYPPGMYVLVADGGSYLVTGADADLTIGVPVISSEAAAFLARTSGLDGTHTSAYTALIDGLVADGLWARFDMLHVYATQDSATALLNLVSTSYNGTANGSPTFTADRGYTGVNGSGTVYISMGFTPSSAPSPKYTANSAHVSVWSVAETGGNTNSPIGASGGGNNTAIFPIHSSLGAACWRINSGGLDTAASATTVGHYVANRPSSSILEGYRNGTIQVTNGASTSAGVSGSPFYTLSCNVGAPTGSPHQVAMASIGSSLSSGEVTAFYNRLRTYMTAVGVP